MADFPLLKDMIDLPLVRQMADRIRIVHPDFDDAGFCAAVATDLPKLALKQRFNLVADALRDRLPGDYPTALGILVAILDEKNQPFEPIADAGFRLLPIAAFVERHGLSHPQASLDAIPAITRHVTCEGAIRPFIERYPAETMERLRAWVRDPDEHVRRLVSEGTRPRLPWATQISAFIADPTPALGLLQQLNDDPSLYVRRSVANHLNDISKDHPGIVLERMASWSHEAPRERLWLINHALRSLVKQGDPAALAILGYGAPNLRLTGLTLSPRKLIFGGQLRFAFQLRNMGGSQKLMIDYRLHFVKANGKTAPKVFKLKKAMLPAGETLRIEKRHAIRAISTRRYYPGRQRLEIQVNGRVLGGQDFELEMEAD